MPDTKLISFYLPQFHPIEENNQWWGPGFTEWNNVVKSRPRFRGHYQPHLPSDTGFYDLRLHESRMLQAEIARSHGIYGFCYYHYWFNEKILLGKPLEGVINSGEPSFPFCLCWANENWTRAWDGLENQVLIEQNYSKEDNERHISYLLKIFHDKRYIRIDNKPLFLIYRIDNIPNIGEMLDLWRKKSQEQGFEDLFFCAVRNSFTEYSVDEMLAFGFDSVVDFQPNRKNFPQKNRDKRVFLYDQCQKILPDKIYQYMKRNYSATKRISYTDMVNNIMNNWSYRENVFPCVFPSWDNSPRRSTPTVIQNLDVKQYGHWLKWAIERVVRYNDEKKIVFINAWNEWAEGCHLEPDQKFGKKFLEETNRVVSLYNQNTHDQ